jgi:hypothetical protein
VRSSAETVQSTGCACHGSITSRCFCALLDRHRGGQFLLSPADLRASRQYYLPDTGVLVTEMHCPTGIVEVTDAMLLRAGADLADNARAPLTANCCAMRVYYKGMPRCGL